MTLSPTGVQYEISSGPHRAVVTEVGATLRSYAVGGRDVVHGFGEAEVIKGGRGQNLLPWPNRLRDGKYTFDGVDQQLVLSEPARHNAIHGLVRHQPWVLVEHAADSVTQRIVVYPQPGWPGVVEATITHRVAEDGLTVDVQATNRTDHDLPFGYAAHPYLSVGEETVDEVTVTVPASSYLRVDGRLLPVEVSPVEGTELDWRAGAVLGEASLDTAYTDLAREDDGRWWVRLALGERHAALWADEAFGWTQVFTGGPYRNWSIAVEPMTCGPDAFNPGPTHDGLIRLAPDQPFSARWGIVGG
ncbi:MAG TPA: aldose 1-epimerase family protein [Propionibacteriaceae bacterium]